MMDFDRRRAGVLLHISSLPGNGDLGDEAHHFLHFMSNCGLTVWQMLPVGPTGPDLSPYQSTSVFAGNPDLISLEQFVHLGWIEAQDLTASRTEVFQRACRGCMRSGDSGLAQAFTAFVARNASWLDDFALFQVLHDQHGCGWWEWPPPLRERESEALRQAADQWSDAIQRVRFEQFAFSHQWEALRKHAAQQGILLFGDLPIFVSLDSAEVWTHRELFELDVEGRPRVVSGVPPDYFSATGQRWGNPLYRWDQMAESGFDFWIRRLERQLALFDLVRIDHFRGFADYWEIPADELDAVNGRWRQGPGDALFDALRLHFGRLPIVAEDLGLITDEVRALRDRQRLPGMQVLQFAFDGEPANPYLPYNHPINAVVYTGTHDNDTVVGWFEGLSHEEQARVLDYLGRPTTDIATALTHTALMSPARLAVVPMQDLLRLGSDARMNTPGTVTDDNWRWRFNWSQVPPELAAQLRHRIWMTNRL